METIAVEEIEKHRLEQQTLLDNLKTAPQRNKWGQFATSPELALSIARYARQLMGPLRVHFLDPAVGTGAFYSALLQAFPTKSIAAATGVELDPLFADSAAVLWSSRGLDVVKGDFTRQHPPEQRFNLVLTNPPYVRHHHLSASEKDRLKGQLARSLHLHISGLAGLYCYFLLLCHDWMEDQGLAAWLIPSEFMDVNYGATLRRYLTERVTLLHIHRFCPTDAQFTDALVSSAVVIFRKAPPPLGHMARFSFAGPINRPEDEGLVSLDALRRSHKWTQFPARTRVENSGELTLGDIFTIKRGLATGSNDFFVLTAADVDTWQIPSKCLKPILPGPRYLTNDVVDARPDGTPDVNPQLFLIDSTEPEHRIKAAWPHFYEYLQRGRAQHVQASYLASRRTPWYSQEQRPPAPFLCTYMGRGRDGKHPFRFIWNRSQATAHNVYLLLYPKGRLHDALRKHPELGRRVFEALQRITPAQLLSEGRVYGGGLHKVEPKELAKVPATVVLRSIKTHVRIEQQGVMFS